MTALNPIPSNIIPITAIGIVLPPFSLVILAFLWYRLGTDSTVVLKFTTYALLSLLPFLLNLVVQRYCRGVVLPGSGLIAVLTFWVLSIAPLVYTLVTLDKIEIQIALALPSILIGGFYVSATLYMVAALVCGVVSHYKVARGAPQL